MPDGIIEKSPVKFTGDFFTAKGMPIRNGISSVMVTEGKQRPKGKRSVPVGNGVFPIVPNRREQRISGSYPKKEDEKSSVPIKGTELFIRYG